MKPARTCTTPGCTNPAAQPGRCPVCAERRGRAKDSHRGTAHARGYGTRWRSRRADYIRAHPRCVLCRQLADVADHWPTSRRGLVAAHDPDPDADHHLRSLCNRCHRRATAENQPGGWNRWRV